MTHFNMERTYRTQTGICIILVVPVINSRRLLIFVLDGYCRHGPSCARLWLLLSMVRACAECCTTTSLATRETWRLLPLRKPRRGI